MKESTRNVLKRIGKVVAVYYIIDAVVTAIIIAVYAAVNGVDRTKAFIVKFLHHMKEFYKNLFRGNFRGAAAAANDNVLEEAEDFMKYRYGDDFAESVMTECYDVLERRNIPFTRKGDFVSRPISECDVPEDIRRKAE